ncbi:hypothetical protein KY289_012920 [Solanum tuberosum]|nr:hypothetical protein KY289_012920 [Solanum tuberosum]
MASPDTDVPMVPAGESSTGAGTSNKKPKRFEIKKWNAVSLWAWDIVVDNCAICRNHIMDLCEFWLSFHYCSINVSFYLVTSVKLIKLAQQVRNARLLGVFVTMHSTSIALVGGSKLVKCVHLITASGSFRSTVTRIYCWCTVNGRSFGTVVASEE